MDDLDEFIKSKDNSKSHVYKKMMHLSKTEDCILGGKKNFKNLKF